VDAVTNTGRKSEKDLVLIVDDMRVHQMTQAALVAKMDLGVTFAKNGLEAVEKYRQLDISLILMDVNMPEMGGIEATRLIKKLAGDDFIPVIFISGAEGHDVIRCAIEAGGDDFIQRPFPFELLEGKITALRRIAQLYGQVTELNALRAHEVEVAEQLLSGAVESGNVALDQVYIHKQPAETFSGDVQLTSFRPNGDLNVFLGDFTGHGLTASFGALPLSETFRAMTAKGYDAEEILAQINRQMYRLLPTGLFLAAAIVTLTPEGEARIWNGGVPDVMIFSHGKLVKRVVSDHPPLGILPHMNEIKFDLCVMQPNDHIIMVSDGVLEAQNQAGEMFDEKRFLNAIADDDSLQPNSLVNSVLTSLGDFMAGIAPSDDISLIAIPGRVVNGKSEQLATIKDSVKEKSLIHDVWNWSLELQGQSLARINPVAQLLSRLQESEGVGDKWNSIFSILTELYVNALDHGVLKLESSMKEAPDGFMKYFSERVQRLESLSSGSVSVYLQHMRLPNGGRLQVRIDDSGDGFDYQYWLGNKKFGNESQFSGRGILLVSELSESISYTNNGASVEIVSVYQNE